MTEHPGIDKISFTGTIAVGKKVMAACAKTLKKVTLELAGNDACVVCADADLDLAVPSVASGGFFNAGQVCVAAKRVYVHASIYDEFLERLVKEVERAYAIQEDGFAPSVFAPVSNRVQYEVVKGILEDCRRNGHKIVSGGKGKEGKKGFWLEPTIVANPPEESVIVQREQFGEFPLFLFLYETVLSRFANHPQGPSSPSCPGRPKTTSSPAPTWPTPGSARRCTPRTWRRPSGLRAGSRRAACGSTIRSGPTLRRTLGGSRTVGSAARWGSRGC